jgi:signal transduction histidine kinase
MNHTAIRRSMADCSDTRVAAASLGVAMDLRTTDQPAVLLGVPDAALANRLTTELKNVGASTPAIVSSTLAQLKDVAAKSSPVVIFLDTDLLAGRSLTEAVRQLSGFGPIVVLASVSNQSEIAPLLNRADLDFIGRVGDFVPLAAALIERQVHRSSKTVTAAEDDSASLRSEKLGELFRHEINNPLTGILGNAELVLAHRERLSSTDIQRLQTVVDLAVRLRESIRKISDASQIVPSHTV